MPRRQLLSLQPASRRCMPPGSRPAAARAPMPGPAGACVRRAPDSARRPPARKRRLVRRRAPVQTPPGPELTARLQFGGEAGEAQRISGRKSRRGLYESSDRFGAGAGIQRSHNGGRVERQVEKGVGSSSAAEGGSAASCRAKRGCLHHAATGSGAGAASSVRMPAGVRRVIRRKFGGQAGRRSSQADTSMLARRRRLVRARCGHPRSHATGMQRLSGASRRPGGQRSMAGARRRKLARRRRPAPGRAPASTCRSGRDVRA